jgi:hypothetical protein
MATYQPTSSDKQFQPRWQIQVLSFGDCHLKLLSLVIWIVELLSLSVFIWCCCRMFGVVSGLSFRIVVTWCCICVVIWFFLSLGVVIWIAIRNCGYLVIKLLSGLLLRIVCCLMLSPCLSFEIVFQCHLGAVWSCYLMLSSEVVVNWFHMGCLPGNHMCSHLHFLSLWCCHLKFLFTWWCLWVVIWICHHMILSSGIVVT